MREQKHDTSERRAALPSAPEPGDALSGPHGAYIPLAWHFWPEATSPRSPLRHPTLSTNSLFAAKTLRQLPGGTGCRELGTGRGIYLFVLCALSSFLNGPSVAKGISPAAQPRSPQLIGIPQTKIASKPDGDPSTPARRTGSSAERGDLNRVT